MGAKGSRLTPHNPVHQHTTFLYTHDLAATALFYERVLGLPLVLDEDGCRIYRVSKDNYLGFCQRDTAPTHPSGVILTIVTPEVDRWYRRLSDRGVAFEKSPAFSPRRDVYRCLLRDPNGYLIEIQRLGDPSDGDTFV